MLSQLQILNDATNSVAYLDGASGSMALQAALAGFLTAGFFLKNQWGYLKLVVARKINRSSEK